MTVRVIPRLDIKGPNLVKGIHLEGLRVLGRPEAYARRYYEQGADELCYMDAVASLYGRNSLLEIVERTAREIFIPLTVGGGLRSVEDMREVLRAGADKVAVNSAAIRDPQLIHRASRVFGSSTIVLQIDAIRTPGSAEPSWEAYVDGGREETGVDVLEWAARGVELGAGELLVTSIDQEGTGKGFDLELVKRLAEAVPVPVIACGGAGSADDVAQVVTEGRADAVALASLLHYEAIGDPEFVKVAAQEEGNTEFLKKNARFSKVEVAPLGAVKRRLARAGVGVRLEEPAA